MSIPQNLKRLRAEAGLSQADLAKNARVSQQLISQLERGENVSTKYLPRIAAALNVSVDAIDPSYTLSASGRPEMVAELEAIFERLADHPHWQQYLLEQARQLESRVLGPAVEPAPPETSGPRSR